MTSEEHEAVKEVLLDRLHTTDDETLQAALWMVLADHDDTERRRVAALQILTK